MRASSGEMETLMVVGIVRWLSLIASECGLNILQKSLLMVLGTFTMGTWEAGVSTKIS